MPIPDPMSDGDAAFLGVNMNVEPSQIPQAHVALANNVRFDKGRITTRVGTKCMDWSSIEMYENKPYAADSKVLFSGKKGDRISFVTVNNSSGYNIGNSLTITVVALSAALSSGDTVTFKNGGLFTLTSNADAGAVSIVGNLTRAAVVHGEVGESLGISNVANALDDGNFVTQSSLTTSTTPWYKELTPTNANSGWVINTSEDVAEILAPARSVINLNQDIASVNGATYGVDVTVKSMTAALTVAGTTTTNGVTKGYNISDKVVKAGASTIAGADGGNGGFSPSTTSQFKVEPLERELSSGTVLIWFDGTTVTAKFTLTSKALIGNTELYGTLSDGNVADNSKGYVDQTITTQALFVTSSPSVMALTAGDVLYFDNRATFIVTQNASGGATTVKGTIHQNTLPVGAKGYGRLKVFVSNTGGKYISITDGPFPKRISLLLTAGANDSSKLKVQADSNWVGEIDSVTLSEPAGVVISNSNGPLSNSAIGPVFKRKSNDNNKIIPPLNNGSIDSTNWEELTGHKIFGLGTIYGVGSFNDPNGNETILVATNSGLYGSSNGGFFSIPIPTGEAFTEDVEFVQAFHEVLVFRGFNKRPLILRDMVEGLVYVDQRETDTSLEENESDGTSAIPNAKTGIFYQNRMLIPVESGDEVIVSDFLNPTRYQNILSEFRINTGTSDSLVGLKVADETTGTILAFKEKSVYRLSNVYGALESVVLDTVTLDYGAINPKVITSVGKDIWFLSDRRGLSSLGLADNGKLTGADIPVSEAVQPIINQTNWNAAKDVACAAYNNNKYYLALPTEGSSEVNKILIYSFINQSWQGYDTSDVITGMEGFVELFYNGSNRLFIVDKNGFFHLYDDETYGSDVDDIPSSTTGVVTKTAITTEVLSRGYSAGTPAGYLGGPRGGAGSFKKWRSATLRSKTLNPTFTVDAEFEGINESVNLVSNKTYDRTKFDRPYDAADYTVTSANRFFDSYRQDYTVQANDFSTAFTDAPTSGAVFDPDLMADHENRYAFRGDGMYMQLRIKNTTGRQDVAAINVGAIPGETLTYKKQ